MSKNKGPVALARQAARKAQTALRRAKKADEKAAAAFEKKRPTCSECGGRDAMPVGGDRIYPHLPEFHALRYWLCPCGAYVGCHKGTNDNPLGTPAGPATRKARNAAHAVFDPLWKAAALRDDINPGHARARGYRWLSEQLGIERAECHISMMDQARCARVVEICAPFTQKRAREPGQEG